MTPAPVPATNEMLINVAFAVRMSGMLLDVPADELQVQTERFMKELTAYIIDQHPYADLNGNVTVTVQMTRD